MEPNVCALVLAAGKGTRMYSESKPKVMVNILGRPMLGYVLGALRPACGDAIRTVIGFQADVVRKAFPEFEDRFVVQHEQLGTGHALQVAWESIKASGAQACVVINGDTPLVSADMIGKFIKTCARDEADLSFASIRPEGENKFGRVVRDSGGNVQAIVEAKDYDISIHGPASGEVNAGIYYFRLDTVEPLLGSLSNTNKSGEYYITDLVEMALKQGSKVTAVEFGNNLDLLGINNPAELIEAEERLRKDIIKRHAMSGVIIRMPDTVRIGPDVTIAPGVDIQGPCEIVGKTGIAAGTSIEAYCSIADSTIDTNVRVKAHSHLDQARVGTGCDVGPYARLRPGAVMEEGSRVGNFVEMKKSTLGKGSKASHLTYLGDAEIAEGVNIGAGTITCNYDGRNKHKTTILDGAFIGSNTALVAPVTIGRNALVGAGSTITKNVEDGKLALTRAKQLALPIRK